MLLTIYYPIYDSGLSFGFQGASVVGWEGAQLLKRISSEVEGGYAGDGKANRSNLFVKYENMFSRASVLNLSLPP